MWNIRGRFKFLVRGFCVGWAVGIFCRIHLPSAIPGHRCLVLRNLHSFSLYCTHSVHPNAFCIIYCSLVCGYFLCTLASLFFFDTSSHPVFFHPTLQCLFQLTFHNLMTLHYSNILCSVLSSRILWKLHMQELKCPVAGSILLVTLLLWRCNKCNYIILLYKLPYLHS